MLSPLIFALLVACGGDDGSASSTTTAPTTSTPRSEPSDLLDPPEGVIDREWQAVSILDGDEDLFPPVDATVTVRFGEQTVSGSAGCNDYSGDMVFAAASVEISPIAITEMACLGVEDWFPMLDVLENAVLVEFVGPSLVVRTADDRALFLK